MTDQTQKDDGDQMAGMTTAERICRLILDGNGLGKTGSDVIISCEDGGAAETLMDLLVRLADETFPVTSVRSDATTT